MKILTFLCYGRPLLQAWLLPDLNTIPNYYIRENSLRLSGYGVGFWCTRSLVRFLPCIYSFVSLLRTLFVRSIITRKGLFSLTSARYHIIPTLNNPETVGF